MKKIRTALLLSLCLLLAGCSGKKQEKEEAPAHAVEITSVEKKEIGSKYVYSGKIKPVKEANVFSTIGGKAGAVYYDKIGRASCRERV